MERASPSLREAQEREWTWAGICLRPAGSCGGGMARRGSGQKEGTPLMGRWGWIELLQPSIRMSTKVMGTKLAEPRVTARSAGIY